MCSVLSYFSDSRQAQFFPDSSVIQHKENRTDHSVIKQRPVHGLGLIAKHKNSRVRNSLLETSKDNCRHLSSEWNFWNDSWKSFMQNV